MLTWRIKYYADDVILFMYYFLAIVNFRRSTIGYLSNSCSSCFSWADSWSLCNFDCCGQPCKKRRVVLCPRLIPVDMPQWRWMCSGHYSFVQRWFIVQCLRGINNHCLRIWTLYRSSLFICLYHCRFMLYCTVADRQQAADTSRIMPCVYISTDQS